MLVSLMSMTAVAKETHDCEQLIAVTEELMKAYEDERKFKDRQLREHQEAYEAIQEQLQEKSAWYRSPEIAAAFAFALGMTLGGTLK